MMILADGSSTMALNQPVWIVSSACLISVNSESQNQEVERVKRLKKISALKKQLEKHEAQSAALNQEIKDKQQALFKGREEYDKLR